MLNALNRNPPKGWRALGVITSRQEIDYVNSKGKHMTYSYVLTENGVRIMGKKGMQDISFE